MFTLANSEDPDEMPHNAAFHQSLHCLQTERQKLSSEIQFYLEIITCDPSIYTIDHPKLLYQTRRKNPLVHKSGQAKKRALLVLLYCNR